MKDMSKECGMHYEEYWAAVHIHGTMTQEAFDAWFNEHCCQCTKMYEICMAGEE